MNPFSRERQCAELVQPEGFDLWNVQGTWFWLLIYPHRGGGAIGVAPTKTEAVREACMAIDRLSEPWHETPKLPGL